MSFSGRNKKGNSIRILDFINENLDLKYEVTRLDATELKISPCLNCAYQCFNDKLKCPKEEDDVSFIYENLIKSDISIMTIPVYSAAPPSTYFALRERSQSIFVSDEIEKEYDNTKKLYIIIGNTQAGAVEAMNIILSESKKSRIDNVLVLESCVYGQRSTDGNLMKEKLVQDRVYDFLLRHNIDLKQKSEDLL